jgi:hypothetical protein
MAQTNGPSNVFAPAIEEIRGQTQIPIMLPSKLPMVIRETEIMLAYGEITADGYSVSLYYSELGSDATFAAYFAGSKQRLGPLGNTRPVELRNGLMGRFRPVSCGGSCAPANLWWEQNGITYQIQIKFASTTDQTQQQKILVETANSSVLVRK